MNDEQKTPADDGHEPVAADDQPTVDETAVQHVPPAAPEPDASATTEQPTVVTSPSTGFSVPRSRNALIASGAGLVLAGGLVGFGIGHASAGDGSGITPASQFVPGEGRQNFGDGERPDGPPGGFGDRDRSGDGTDDQSSSGDNDPT